MKREDWRAALIACATYNVNRGKDDEALSPEDLLPWLKTPDAQRPQPPAAITRDQLEEINFVLGGTAKIAT